MPKNPFEGEVNLPENNPESQLFKERLDDLRKIFGDFEINLAEKTGVGKISFEEIRTQMQGVRDQYQEVLNSAELSDDDRNKYRVELEEMDDFLLGAIIDEATK